MAAGGAWLWAVLRVLAGRRDPAPGVVSEGRLSGRYLVRRTPTHLHRGIDIRAPKGAPIRSLNNGYVYGIYADCERSGYGNSILIQHNDGTLGFFAHLDRFPATIAEGQFVLQGQVIGYVGDTECGLRGDRGMIPHLHLEVHTRLQLSPGGWPLIAETVPPRMDPLAYLEQVGMPIADRPLEA